MNQDNKWIMYKWMNHLNKTILYKRINQIKTNESCKNKRIVNNVLSQRIDVKIISHLRQYNSMKISESRENDSIV